MSFAGGPGHKSPFAERAKATKSHLSPRRTSAASGVRSAQQSLFGKESPFGGKDSQLGDSSAKVSQLRNAGQPDVKEPTTPTRASEGSNVKGIRRDEFSSFNNRRVGTPVKTPRTAFGTVPPRSPKRPYIGSPKYQKVLLERPAFYNSPAAGEPLTESGRKEVSISELQKRLKRFLQDENVPSRRLLEVTPSSNLDEVPYNISRSPRVNPLFHHDETVLQVAKGGVAFTAGVGFPEEDSCVHTHADSTKEKDDHNAGIHFAKGGVAFTAGESLLSNVSAELVTTPEFPEAVSVVSQSLPEDEPVSNDVLNETSEASETEQSLGPEDFPVHSEGVDGSQVEEVFDEVVAPEVSASEELPAQLEQQSIATSAVEVEECPIEDATPVSNSASVGVTLEEEAQEEVDVKAEDSVVAEQQMEAKADCASEEEVEEEIEIFESWSQRFLKFVVLSVMVACMMGFMVLASGSQGLLPKSLHSKPVASPFSSSSFTPSVIPVSVGFMGLGIEHEGMPCLPSVHLGLKFLSSSSKSDASQRGSASPSHTSELFEPITVTRKDPKLVGIDNVMDWDQLMTVTNYYKEVQGRLLSDVASLTSESALSDSSKAGMLMDGEQSAAVEDVSETAVFEEVADVTFEDVAAGAAIEDVMLSEDVSESTAMEDISELVDEIAEKQKLGTLFESDEFGHAVPEETLTAQNPESLQNILDETSVPETEKLPADIELDMLNLVNHVSDEVLHAVPTTEFVSSETILSMEYLSTDSEDSVIEPQLTEDNSSVVELSITEPASNDIPSISDEVSSLLDVPPVTEEISTDEYRIASPVLGTAEDNSLGSFDLLGDLKEELVNMHHEEPPSQSTTEAVNSNEGQVKSLSEGTCLTPVSNVVVPALREPVAEGSYPLATIGLLVGALALAVVFLLSMSRKSPRVSQAAETATNVNLFPGTTAPFKSMSSPVLWPSTRSVYDSHIPDRDELDAITSPLKSFRAPRQYGMESYSTKYGSAEPTFSAPGLFKAPATVVQQPATTWHPAMKAVGSTISSAYRQTASYIPAIPSESGISTSTRGASDMDSVCESALTMGAEEWEHLGSFTTTDLVTVVNEGGAEQKVRTPVRRSQRIRNRVSPLPERYNDFL